MFDDVTGDHDVVDLSGSDVLEMPAHDPHATRPPDTVEASHTSADDYTAGNASRHGALVAFAGATERGSASRTGRPHEVHDETKRENCKETSQCDDARKAR